MPASSRGRSSLAPPPHGTAPLVELVCRGGWPDALDADVAGAQAVAREYLRLLATESVPAAGRDGETAARLIASLARNLGQAATYRTIAADMHGGEEEPSSPASDETISSYLGLLKCLCLVDEIPGWVPQARSRRRLATKPRRYLADPSPAVAQLGMGPRSLLDDWRTFGLTFESMCMRDLLVYAQALPGIGYEPVRYYRDDTGLEADAVVELADGRWAAFEVRVGDDKIGQAVADLRCLRRKLCENAGARVRPPEFMAVVAGLSPFAYQADEGIYVVPIRALGA